MRTFTPLRRYDDGSLAELFNALDATIIYDKSIHALELSRWWSIDPQRRGPKQRLVCATASSVH